MAYKRILTIQDISCVGQCSLTVALPILSACGLETAILPSAVLSTHTAGFSGYTFRDLTEDIPEIQKHWEKEGIKFEAIYTGYLGSSKQISYVKNLMNSVGARNCIKIVDPAMADNGSLYPGFDMEYVECMKELAFSADYILPNITEACLLTGTEFRREYDKDYIEALLKHLLERGTKNIILTGVSYKPGRTGVVICQPNKTQYYEHQMIEKGCHGTGDVYASAFVGALLNEKDPVVAASIAADFVVKCIQNTKDDSNHWYGVKFETALLDLITHMQ